MNMTETFAEEMYSLDYGALNSADLEQIGRLLLDYSAVAYGGSARPWVAALRKWASTFLGTGSAGVVGGLEERVAPDIAAFVNATAAHSFELDDTHDPSMSHPGAVVMSTALAVGGENRVSGRDCAAAIAAGYEAVSRIGLAANAGKVVMEGFHPTALFGVFGAATTAAKLLGLDTHGLLRSWGHALSLSGGSMQFSDEPQGTAVKRVHAGFAARNGILAAQLSAAGVSAPLRAVDGKYGLLALFGRDPRPERLLRDPDALFQIHAISLKPYSCCRLFHSLIDGLRDTTGNFTIALRSIRDIRVRAPTVIVEQHMLRRPTSPMAAQYSMPYTVGATLVFGPTRFDAYEEQHLNNESILTYADLVQVEADRELDSRYPEHMGSAVTLVLDDSSTRSAWVLDSLGTPARPMSRCAARAKVEYLTRSVDPSFDVEALEQATQSLPTDAGAEALEALTSIICSSPVVDRGWLTAGEDGSFPQAQHHSAYPTRTY